jgi:hypothetical protein
MATVTFTVYRPPLVASGAVSAWFLRLATLFSRFLSEPLVHDN